MPQAMVTALRLSPVSYGVCWWLIFVIHGCHIFILCRIIISLVNTVRRPLTTSSFLQAIGITFEPAFAHAGAAFAAIMLVFHSVDTLRLLFGSLRARRLTLIRYTLLSEPKPLSVSPRPPLYQRLIHGVRRLRWLLSTRSPWFETVYHTKEVTEIVLQSVQAYRVSYMISHVWTNQFATAVILLNAWSSPVLYRVFRSSFVKRRVSCLLVDVVLDFTTSMAVPLMLYFAYLQLIETRLLYDPVWMLTVGNDLLQFTNNSVFDLAFRVTGSVSMVLSLRTLQALIRRADVASDASFIATPAAVVPTVPRPPDTQPKSPPEMPLVRKPWIPVVHVLLTLYGVAMLSVYGLASPGVTARVVPGCHLTMRQWFTKDAACSVLEINCHARGLTGASDELTLALNEVDRLALSALTISHCSDVHVPPAILDFHNLVWLEIDNSTLVEWPASATPTQTTSPKLSRVLLVGVTFSSRSLPEGLFPTHNDVFPASLVEFVFVRTSIAWWPSDLASHWNPQHVQAILLENCGLTQVPLQLQAFRLKRLSLAYNSIQELPAWLFDGSKKFSILSVAGNPLQTLPAAISASENAIFKRLVGKTTQVNGVFLQNTNISTLPAWATHAGLCTTINLLASGSPVCGDREKLSQVPCEAAATHCDPTAEPVGWSGRFFPVETHDTQFPYERIPASSYY